MRYSTIVGIFAVMLTLVTGCHTQRPGVPQTLEQ